LGQRSPIFRRINTQNSILQPTLFCRGLQNIVKVRADLMSMFSQVAIMSAINESLNLCAST
jgi:hypothetical protein